MSNFDSTPPVSGPEEDADSEASQEIARFQYELTQTRRRTGLAILAVAGAVAAYGAYHFREPGITATTTDTEPVLSASDSGETIKKETKASLRQPEKPDETDAERTERVFLEDLERTINDTKLWKENGSLFMDSHPFYLLAASASLSQKPYLHPSTTARLDAIFSKFLERLVYTRPRDFEQKFPDATGKTIFLDVKKKNIEDAFRLLDQSYPFWKNKPYAQEIIAVYKAIHKRSIVQ